MATGDGTAKSAASQPQKASFVGDKLNVPDIVFYSVVVVLALFLVIFVVTSEAKHGDAVCAMSQEVIEAARYQKKAHESQIRTERLKTIHFEQLAASQYGKKQRRARSASPGSKRNGGVASEGTGTSIGHDSLPPSSGHGKHAAANGGTMEGLRAKRSAGGGGTNNARQVLSLGGPPKWNTGGGASKFRQQQPASNPDTIEMNTLPPAPLAIKKRATFVPELVGGSGGDSTLGGTGGVASFGPNHRPGARMPAAPPESDVASGIPSGMGRVRAGAQAGANIETRDSMRQNSSDHTGFRPLQAEHAASGSSTFRTDTKSASDMGAGTSSRSGDMSTLGGTGGGYSEFSKLFAPKVF